MSTPSLQTNGTIAEALHVMSQTGSQALEHSLKVHITLPMFRTAVHEIEHSSTNYTCLSKAVGYKTPALCDNGDAIELARWCKAYQPTLTRKQAVAALEFAWRFWDNKKETYDNDTKSMPIFFADSNDPPVIERRRTAFISSLFAEVLVKEFFGLPQQSSRPSKELSSIEVADRALQSEWRDENGMF